MKNITIALLLIAAGILIGIYAVPQRCSPAYSDTVTDTVVIYDTVTVSNPDHIDIDTVVFDTIRKPVVKVKYYRVTDTIIIKDTLESYSSAECPDIIIPVIEKTYGDSTYKAVVRGPSTDNYGPELREITIYPKTVTVTKAVFNTRSPKWVLSVGPGIGLSASGKVEPGIHITLGYVIKSW